MTTPNDDDIDKLTEAFNNLHITKPSEKKLDAVLTDFENRTATNPHHPGQNLRKLLDDSPYLKDQFVNSAEHGYLERLDVLPAGANAAGTYDSNRKSIALPPDKLKAVATGKRDAAEAEMVFVMGHEIQHSLNSKITADVNNDFGKDIWKTALESRIQNYTATIDMVIQNYRRDEASANINGFNALALQVQKENANATLEDFYKAAPERMKDIIDRKGTESHFTYSLKPGFTVDENMHMDASKDNVEAMSKYFFDKTGHKLGKEGKQDYRSFYGNSALNYIHAAQEKAKEEQPDPNRVAQKAKINLVELGLNKAQIDTPLDYDNTGKRKNPATPSEESHPPAKHAKGPFSDPAINEAFQAMRSGNDTGVTQAAQQMKHSPEGQRLTQTAQNLLTEQQRQESSTQTQAQPQAPARPLSR